MNPFWRILVFAIAFFIINSASSSPIPEEVKDEPKEDSSDDVDEKDLGTISPTEMKKLVEKVIESEKEDAEKFGVPFTNSPEDVETYLKNKEEEVGEKLPEEVEEELTKTDDDFKDFVHFVALFDKIQTEASEEEEEKVVKSPAEMQKMKAEVFKLINELNEEKGFPEISQEDFDEAWNKKKKEYGKRFPAKVEKMIVLLKTIEEEEEVATNEVSEILKEATTIATDLIKEEPPKDAFILRNANGKICILAKFHSTIIITYPGKTYEQKVEVTVPLSGHVKGKCEGPDKPSSLKISWGKFIFSLHFNKTSEDLWSVTLVQLTYDTSEGLFDGAANLEKVTAKSKKVSLFETPVGKSYYCPAQEVIILYNENQQVANVDLKEIHLQPYAVEDGKFSTIHRCNRVDFGGLDEEPFVQDETVPLAVGCTLALITLLILVGFSVHRAYNAAKVDYNTVE